MMTLFVIPGDGKSDIPLAVSSWGDVVTDHYVLRVKGSNIFKDACSIGWKSHVVER